MTREDVQKIAKLCELCVQVNDHFYEEGIIVIPRGQPFPGVDPDVYRLAITGNDIENNYLALDADIDTWIRSGGYEIYDAVNGAIEGWAWREENGW